LFDAIVVGSGAAGTFAAYPLRGLNTLMLDVGLAHTPARRLNRNLYDLLKTGGDLSRELLGDEFESLANIDGSYLSPKLKSPLMRFVTRDWARLSPVEATGFEPIMSFAMGGLANGWGAGVYRCTPDELRGFPISVADLEPFYDELTAHMGISGTDDDLTSTFGSAAHLLPPVQLSRLSESLLESYRLRRQLFANAGIIMGRPRLAVLTRDHGKRLRHDYANLEFFKPRIPSIYNPAFTLEEMIAGRKVSYLSGRLVLHYREHEAHVEITARNLHTGEMERFLGRKVLLAAGAINTAKIVLQSRADCETRLPLLDNAISYVPLLNWKLIGCPLERTALSIAQLNLVYRGPLEPDPVQATYYGITGPLRSDVLWDFPFALQGNLAAARYVMPAVGIMQLFYPDRPEGHNFISLTPEGRLQIRYQPKRLGRLERHLIRVFRRIGQWSAPSLCRYPAPGNSYHYAGCLPMQTSPGPCQTDSCGLLWGTRRVHVVDSANFTVLPAKNLTFTVMANAMRIAQRVREELAGSRATICGEAT